MAQLYRKKKTKSFFLASNKKLFGLAFIGLLFAFLTCFLWQDSSSISSPQANHSSQLERGINLSHWFFQPTDDYTKEHLDSWITEADFRFLEETKITHIRLPIDPIFLQQQEAPYRIEQQNFVYIDRAVQWAQKYHLKIIIDIHPDRTSDLQNGTASQAYQNLEMLWLEIAKRYRSQPQSIFFELLNEPGAKSPETWHEITQKLSQSIREIDPIHTLIVAAPGASGPSEIADLVPIRDDNVIYTFHFYDPMVFTHQRAFWDLNLSKVQNVPYPYDALRLAESRKQVTDPQILEELQWYESVQYSKQQLTESLQAALQFRDRYNVPIYCGEFGVYQFAPRLDKYKWLEDITQLLSEEGIDYALWEYHGSFGVIGEKTEKLDRKMLKAAGLI